MLKLFYIQSDHLPTVEVLEVLVLRTELFHVLEQFHNQRHHQGSRNQLFHVGNDAVDEIAGEGELFLHAARFSFHELLETFRVEQEWADPSKSHRTFTETLVL